MIRKFARSHLQIATLAFLTLFSAIAFAQESSESQQGPQEVTEATIGKTKNVHKCGHLFLAGQFTSDDIAKITDAGIKRVITLRTDGEIDWDEKAKLKAAGLDLIEVPFRSPESLTDEVFNEVRKLLADKETATLFHCGSANRVGGVWLPHRVLDEGIDLETALQEAKTIGLRNDAYEKKALDYIERMQKAKDDGSLSRNKLNSRFLDPDLDVESFVKRFEIDNREVYAARTEILRAMNLKPGQRVADVGAGTGFYTHLFSGLVGESGWVFAVDISPKFIQHINSTISEKKIDNVSVVLCQHDSIDVPPNSLDVAYVCDTYHHFEFHAETSKSIFNALKSGGELIVVDFDRIPGKSRDWIMGHVRAGKKAVKSELESVGFTFVEQVDIPGLDENYFIRFRK